MLLTNGHLGIGASSVNFSGFWCWTDGSLWKKTSCGGKSPLLEVPIWWSWGPWQLTPEGNGQDIQPGKIDIPLFAREAEMVGREGVDNTWSSGLLLDRHLCFNASASPPCWFHSSTCLPHFHKRGVESFTKLKVKYTDEPFPNERPVHLILQNGLMPLI